MGSKEWSEAAEIVETQKLKPEIEAKEIAEATHKLDAFLNGVEGESAKRLLKATAEYILLGELPASPGHAVVCLLDGDGLKKSIEGSGLSGAYANKKPDVSTATAEQAVNAFKRYEPPFSRPRAADIITHIHAELDKIAKRIKREG